MKRLIVRDPITHEPLGVLLTSNPDLWDEWAEPSYAPPEPHHVPEHDTSWAELFGLEED